MTDYTYLSSQIKIDIWLSGYKLGLSIIQVHMQYGAKIVTVTRMYTNCLLE